jgi:hypothetical protein
VLAANLWSVSGTIGILAIVIVALLMVFAHLSGSVDKDKALWFWGTLGLLFWLASWTLIWIGRETSWLSVFEPAAVGAALGAITICVFIGVYLASTDNRLRTAFAGAFLIFYLSLATTLLVLNEFRDQVGSGGTTNVAEDLLTQLPWVLTTVIGFYFVTDTVKSGQDKKLQREKEKTLQEQERTTQATLAK